MSSVWISLPEYLSQNKVSFGDKECEELIKTWLVMSSAIDAVEQAKYEANKATMDAKLAQFRFLMKTAFS